MIFLLLFIARSKLVPDFAITIHFLNLVVTSLYTKALPTQLFWWILKIASAGLMTFLGVWACQWRELKPIQFGGKGKQRAVGGPSGQISGQTDEEAGFASGDGRGAGKDGSGVYEMVGMPRKDDAG